MQAITTKYIGPTNYRGSRVKATCQAGSLTLSWDDALDAEANHDKAAIALADKLGWREGWRGDMVRGALPDGRGNVYVFTGRQNVFPEALGSEVIPGRRTFSAKSSPSARPERKVPNMRTKDLCNCDQALALQAELEQLTDAVLLWAKTPGDHGGNPYCKAFVKAAERANEFLASMNDAPAYEPEDYEENLP